MSRIGKLPVSVPAEIKVTVNGDEVTFEKGKIKQVLDTKGNVGISFEDKTLTFTSKSDDRKDRAFWGTYRSLAANIVTGLTTGYSKQLEINGVGYRAAVKGKTLNLQLGFSHDIDYPLPEGLTAEVEKNVITLKSHDKQVLGQVASEIRAYRPPEPYKGKGVKYMEEHIVRKAGKTAKK
ncbi:MAG: 50S ribosomal protein L6 [Campylobacterota bacterium]|nr:50S ribosomal protein L6 [Campylobacterota bacterium]